MSDAEQKWILVTDPSELRAGMTVKIKNSCRSYLYPKGQTFVMILTRPKSGFCHDCNSDIIGWHSVSGEGLCPYRAIPERRLFRMDTGESDEAQQREGHILYNVIPNAIRVRNAVRTK